MANPDSSSSATLPSITSSAAPPISSLLASMAEYTVPAPLKFLMSNLKSIVSLQLSNENYAIWSLQNHKLFVANGFERYLTGRQVCPSGPAIDPEYKLWHLVDQNRVLALFSTISPSVLPYVQHLSTAHEIWIMLASRLQPTNRYRVIQLKNELHNIQMRDSTMTQYLAQVKTLVDNIAVAGSCVDSEDIVMYILNGLLAPYNPFKSSIRTSQLPISLETLYSLLCSEEINIQNELRKDAPFNNMAFYSSRGRYDRGRSSSSNSRGRGPSSRQ
ncbi:hypothetical protein KFK09_006848 [Dendrobium nobile]|uniref:Retrovirus-related Pol polyprotein from transposon TNT 1-94 n=1 Tax=Dendrobium nobile TaxID=94219 RepID=A0A8T3BQD5_DENNO|nr:hypothetical protein KFK09_006848 [Dendrobium nobile]